jgi:hypothetical protein
VDNLETAALPPALSSLLPSRNDDEVRGIVQWAKWLGIAALCLYAGNMALSWLLMQGLFTNNPDYTIAYMFFVMFLDTQAVKVVISILFIIYYIAALMAWFYYFPESIRAFLFIIACFRIIDGGRLIVINGSFNISQLILLVSAAAMIIACIFVVKPSVFWSDSTKPQRRAVSILYSAVIIQWLAFAVFISLNKDEPYSKLEYIAVALAICLLLSRAKLGWVVCIPMALLATVFGLQQGLGGMSYLREPFLPAVILILLFLPPVIRWYFPTGIWAYMRSLEVKRG